MDVLYFSDGSTRKKNQNKNSSLQGENVQGNNACENCLRGTRNYGDVNVERKVYN